MDDYIQKRLYEVLDIIRELKIDKKIISGLFIELRKKNLLSLDVQKSIVDLLYFSNDKDNAGINPGFYDDIFEKIYDLYVIMYRKYSAPVFSHNFPVFDFYVNCKCYFSSASKILCSPESTNFEYKEHIYKEVRDLFISDLNEKCFRSLANYFYMMYFTSETPSGSELAQLVEYLQSIISKFLTKFSECINDNNLDYNNFFNAHQINGTEMSNFKFSYQNSDSQFYFITVPLRSKIKIYLTIDKLSFCPVCLFTANSIEISKNFIELFNDVVSNFSFNLQIFNLSLNHFVDNLVKILAFEFKSNCDFSSIQT